ncbi:MAG: four helix bundle protein [Bacteroidetes bacterium RIFCSPLOWO2_12_FULL_35_15]|nr:MAG: four helix bundle protein [Bacteroidetes bacterium RIFCSPLOWO2_12_FULL_35_15]
MNNFEELEAWKLARELRNEVSILVRKFPAEEKFRLIDQVIRSSRSVTANIAEGYGRFHYQENIQYCRQARGSITETLDHLICAKDNSYIDEKVLNEYRIKINHNIKVLNGYIAYLIKRKEES